ncbi:MAG TPA: hypothetical protein GX734_04735 [Clostridiaceae bacterium]|nr:hypothetical protein [Clostridiaceae bacterium]
MAIFINTFVLLFLTVVIGYKLASIRIRGSSLGAAMVLFTGILISFLVGTYINSLPDESTLKATGQALMDNSIVPSSVLSVFLVFFISGVGLVASKELLPVLKKYGLKFLAMAIIITTLGMAGTFAIGKISGNYDTFEMSGVFSGALSSTPGMTAGLLASTDKAKDNLENYDTLDKDTQEKMVEIIGEPGAEGFSEEQKKEYVDYASTATGIGYTITFPFGNLLVLVAINLIPLMFRINIRKEREEYELEMASSHKQEKSGDSTGDEKEDATKTFSVTAYFLVLAAGYMLGLIKIGSFSLSATGGVLIASLVLGSLKKTKFFDFDFDPTVLKSIREIGMVGTLGATGLRLGYPVIKALTGTQAMLAVYSLIIGLSAIFIGFLIGRYIFKMNWMMLSGALCGGMTNTSGLGIAVDAAGCEYPSIGYAASYPFAVVMMVIYTVMIQGFSF